MTSRWPGEYLSYIYISNEDRLRSAIVLTKTTSIVLCPREAVILNLPFETQGRVVSLYSINWGGRRRTPDNSNNSLMNQIGNSRRPNDQGGWWIPASLRTNILNFQLFVRTKMGVLGNFWVKIYGDSDYPGSSGWCRRRERKILSRTYF